MICRESVMGDTSVTKVQSKYSPRGEMGQKYLASGIHVGMRLWEQEPAGQPKAPSTRAYETVGYVIAGRTGRSPSAQTRIAFPGSPPSQAR
jgi:hypothetical protein